MAKRSQQDSGEERVTAKSKTYDESYYEDAIGRVVFNFSEPSEEILRKTRSLENKILGSPLLQKIDQGNLIAFPQQIIQNWIMTVLGLLKSGKLRLRRTIDQGDLIKFLGERYDKFDPDHEATILDGTAQSVRYGETLRDRSGRPDNINSQEVANSQNFIMGSDTTEFVNRVNDEVRKRQKKCPTLQILEKSILLFGECLWL